MNQFYVVLPSDSSMQYFPLNTVAHFKTKLSACICENGDYEVALTELIYPLNYHNFIVNEPLPQTLTMYGERLDPWYVKSGSYKDEDEMAKLMSEDLSNHIRKWSGNRVNATFSYDKVKKKMKLSLGTHFQRHDGLEISVDGVIDTVDGQPFADCFGIGDNTFELDNSRRLMYVYSDVVSPYLVGDVQVPLLRVVTSLGKRNDTISTTFVNPYYLPVIRRGFDTIEININNELGQPMPFADGKSVAILHFRKAQ